MDASTYDPFARIEAPYVTKPAVACGPLAWNGLARAWVATRHGDCIRVLRSPAFVAPHLGGGISKIIARRGEAMPYLEALGTVAIFGLSGDPHRQLRGMYTRILAQGPPLADCLGALTIEADRLWRAGLKRGSIDIVAEYADPLIGDATAAMLGIDLTMRAAMAECVEGITATFNVGCSISTYRAAEGKLQRLAPGLHQMLQERRSRPRDDRLTALAAAAEEQGLSDITSVALVVMLYLLSFEQTTSLIALAIRSLMGDAEAFAAWCADRCDDDLAVQELARFETPIFYVLRLASADCDVGGQTVRAGERVLLLLGSANRDPEVFANPDRLCLSRANNKHLAFSMGQHACIGARIAKPEVAVALAPLRRNPPVRVGTSDVEWWPFDVLRRMRRFEVEF